MFLLQKIQPKLDIHKLVYEQYRRFFSKRQLVYILLVHIIFNKTVEIQLSVLVQCHAGITLVWVKLNISPVWYSGKIADLVLRNVQKINAMEHWRSNQIWTILKHRQHWEQDIVRRQNKIQKQEIKQDRQLLTESVVLFNSIDNIINNIYLYLHEKHVFLLCNGIQHFGVLSRQSKRLLTKNVFPSIQHQKTQSDVFLYDRSDVNHI